MKISREEIISLFTKYSIFKSKLIDGIGVEFILNKSFTKTFKNNEETDLVVCLIIIIIKEEKEDYNNDIKLNSRMKLRFSQLIGPIDLDREYIDSVFMKSKSLKIIF